MSGNRLFKRSRDGHDQSFPTVPFTIAPHVHVCVTGDGAVFLDLKHDKYLGIGRRDSELLAAAISSWPKPQWDRTEMEPTSDAAVAYTDELCRSLAADGLLISGVSHSAQAAREPLIDMRREWISVGDELEAESKVTVTHVANFVVAFLWARCSLVWRPFSATVEGMRVEKARRPSGIDPNDTVKMTALVGVFRQIRPLVFAAEGRCLLHALTLTRFLNRYGLYPEWVIGVATQPWAAHAWVQCGNLLLDTNPEKVCRYTPILAI
jgi:transglutaminase superfamily protein